MSDLKSYSQFNALTITGRIFNAEIVEYNGNEFLSVSVISTLMKDGPELIVTFTNNNGLMGLYNKGWLPVGRQVTLTGHISDTKFVYTDKTGTVRTLKRPELKLVNAQIMEGGLGQMPKDSLVSNAIKQGTVVQSGAPVDQSPEYGADAKAAQEAGKGIEF